MNSKIDQKNDSRVSETHTISPAELPLACPPQNLWNMHPRVFMNFIDGHQGKRIAKCPYCGAKYQLSGDHGYAH